MAIVLRSLKRAYQLLEENKALIAAGRMAKSDLVQSQTNLANQRIAYQQTLNDVQQARLELLRTLNMNKNTRVNPTEPLKLPDNLPTMKQALALAYANQPALLAGQVGFGFQQARYDLGQKQHAVGPQFDGQLHPHRQPGRLLWRFHRGGLERRDFILAFPFMANLA